MSISTGRRTTAVFGPHRFNQACGFTTDTHRSKLENNRVMFSQFSQASPKHVWNEPCLVYLVEQAQSLLPPARHFYGAHRRNVGKNCRAVRAAADRPQKQNSEPHVTQDIGVSCPLCAGLRILLKACNGSVRVQHGVGKKETRTPARTKLLNHPRDNKQRQLRRRTTVSGGRKVWGL